MEKIMIRLDFKELIFLLLEGGNEITQYQNLLSKALKNQNLVNPLYRMMSVILPQLCDPKIEVSEIGLRSFLRTYEKLITIDEKNSTRTVFDAWLAVTDFTSTTKNKNYNILRNHYKIEELVLQPALFSKQYYRLIHPNYVEEDKVASLTAQPQTPVNSRIYINAKNNFNYVYYIDTLGHEGIKKVELYFPKINQGNKYKIGIRIVELNDDGEHQLFYRYFHEDLLIHLGVESFRDTEIFQKTQINYLSLPNINPSPKCRFLKMEFNLLLITTKAHPRYKELPEPYIVLPMIYSDKNHHLAYNDHPIADKFMKQLQVFPTETKHNSTSERMPPHKFAVQNKKMLYIVHEFKRKYTEETKSQFTETIDKITQNIMDKLIV